ncbi:CoxG family protein [Candidatus Lucifugimonas marina]|uniref:CoxG family protein n=1 Tax=Candidatus Lucifugimonas marina TaxID=3038979 RepID=UPI00319DEA96
MEFVYDRVVLAPITTVWAVLTDPDAMEPHLPKTTKVVPTEDGDYRVSMKVSLGFLRPTVRAKLRLSNVVEQASFTIGLSGKSMGAGVNGEAKMLMSESPEKSGATHIVMTGRVETSGLLNKFSDTKIESAARDFLETYLSNVEQSVQAV